MGQIPSTVWSMDVTRSEPSPTSGEGPRASQTFVCYDCVATSQVPPVSPEQVVMIAGTTYCVAHGRARVPSST